MLIFLNAVLAVVFMKGESFIVGLFLGMPYLWSENVADPGSGASPSVGMRLRPSSTAPNTSTLVFPTQFDSACDVGLFLRDISVMSIDHDFEFWS